MVILLIIVALAMVVAGLLAIVTGSDGVGLESGWALVIAGSVGATGGALLFALALVMRELRTLPDRLEAAHPADASPVRDQSVFETLSAPPEASQFPLPPIPPVVPSPSFPRSSIASGNRGATEEPMSPPAEHEPQPSLAQDAHFPEQAKIEPEVEREPAATAEAQFDSVSRSGPVNRLEPVFPDFSPRSLLRASQGKRVEPVAIGHAGEAALPGPIADRHENDEGAERDVASPADSGAAGSSQEHAAGDGNTVQVSGGAPDDPTEEKESAMAVVGTYRSNGNVYVMYADGSIEAKTPEGVFRFNSLEELKSHIATNGSGPANGKRRASPA